MSGGEEGMCGLGKAKEERVLDLVETL